MTGQVTGLPQIQVGGGEDGGLEPKGDPAVSDEDPGDGDPNSPKLR